MEKAITKPIYQWQVVYTKSRAEKKAHRILTEQGIESFLPVQRQLRQWSDRKKWVEAVVVPGYLFVRISQLEYDQVLQSDHIVSFIRFNGRPAVIRDQEIQQLKQMLSQDFNPVEFSCEQLEPGKNVTVVAGPLAGLKGKLIKMLGRNKISIEMEEIGCRFTVEISAEDISPNL